MKDHDSAPDESDLERHQLGEDLRQLAREAARAELLIHLQNCPFFATQIQERTRQLEIRFATLVGFMFGSGTIGGMAGAAIIKTLSG